MSESPDTVERHEHVDLGFELTIKSKRGTGTRDEDQVTISVEMENPPSTEQIENLTKHVEHVMDMRRGHHPDGDTDE